MEHRAGEPAAPRATSDAADTDGAT
jgi:hypothetical protein